jgi:hypothetical protein
LQAGAEELVRPDITIPGLPLHIVDLSATVQLAKRIVEAGDLVGAVPIGRFNAGYFEVTGADGSSGAGWCILARLRAHLIASLVFS